MPEPLKNLYTTELIGQLSDEIAARYPAFDRPAFEQSIFDTDWAAKELKQRMRHIANCLHHFLPDSYPVAIDILKPVSEKFNGFEYMFFQDFVECYGLDDFETSMQALAHFTKFSSSEFAVRVFILQNEKRMMKQMQKWSNDKNPHLRRLASEGCRPRLPWAMSLPGFKKNPAPVFKILKRLMNDDSDYVRRSVANNLNDISKDHPEQVLDWAKNWSGKHTGSDWIIKHACRSLLKQGHPDALTLFGYRKPVDIRLTGFKLQNEVLPGKKLQFSFQLHTDKKKLGRLRMEYAIGFMKANGMQSQKVFKIGEADYPQQQKFVEKYYSFKPISTRRYYPGEHTLSILVNGQMFTQGSFLLRD